MTKGKYIQAGKPNPLKYNTGYICELVITDKIPFIFCLNRKTWQPDVFLFKGKLFFIATKKKNHHYNLN